MNHFNRNQRIVGVAVFLWALLIYLKTVAPTVSFWDCGEFISCAYILGVPHPPGAPLHILIGRIATLLPTSPEIAFRVNIVSCFCSAFAVLLGYLIVVRLLRAWIDIRNLEGQVTVLTGAAVGALTMAFSSVFWFNSVEAEVYAMSMLITLLAIWIALLWRERAEDPGSDRLLLFIAYLFGLGGGVHLQCLLTIPAIMLLVLFTVSRDSPASKLKIWIAIPFIAPFIAMLTKEDLTIGGFSLVRLLGFGLMLAALIHLASLRPSFRNWKFWGLALLLAGLGFSTYGMPIIRSWADPIIDMNNPGNLQNFQDYVLRKQYGQTYAFPRRGDFWGFQMNIFTKYFLQQFPHWSGFSIDGFFRRAIYVPSSVLERISFSLIPLAVGIGGAIWHARKSWRLFLAMLSLFLIMSLGLVIYLNMPDPEPREREYIFVGAYCVFALWIGMGAAGIVFWGTRTLREAGFHRTWVPILISVAMFVLPVVMMAENYHEKDRTGNFLAHDYASNILETCEKDAIIFTNGDNDTYPLWFMQYVKGFRRDIRVVNLSLIKTDWYIRQLRDLEPRVPINLSDQYIENNFQAKTWIEPSDVTLAGITIDAKEVPIANYPAVVGGQVRSIPVVEQHTWMIWRIVEQIKWNRPIYFALTVPESNHAGLTPFFSWEGMAWRLTKQKTPRSGRFDHEQTVHNLSRVYRYTGLNDPTIYKDPVDLRLLTNYQVIFQTLARRYQELGQDEKTFEILKHYVKVLPPSVIPVPPSLKREFTRILHVVAGQLTKIGLNENAAEALKMALQFDPDYDFNGITREHLMEAIQLLESGFSSSLLVD